MVPSTVHLSDWLTRVDVLMKLVSNACATRHILAYKSQDAQSLFLHFLLPYHHQPVYQNASQSPFTQHFYAHFAIPTLQNASAYATAATHLKLSSPVIVDPERMYFLSISHRLLQLTHFFIAVQDNNTVKSDVEFNLREPPLALLESYHDLSIRDIPKVVRSSRHSSPGMCVSFVFLCLHDVLNSN